MTNSPDTSAPAVQANRAVTRAEAKAFGRKRYFTGVPCPRGHVAEKLVSTCRCVVCTQEDKEIWVTKNPDRQKEAAKRHYEANKDEYKLRSANWAKNNPEKSRMFGRNYRTRNTDRVRARHKIYATANPLGVKARVHCYRARKRSNGGRFTAEDVIRIFRSQKGKCSYCPAKLIEGYEIEHIHPVAGGGSNLPNNIQLLCQTCNRTKSDKDPIQFAQQLGFLL